MKRNKNINQTILDGAKFLQEENKLLKEQVEKLMELERSFYMGICRAYNAGKGNALEMVAEQKKMGETSDKFQSSHEYFVGEFPKFKTNVP